VAIRLGYRHWWEAAGDDRDVDGRASPGSPPRQRGTSMPPRRCTSSSRRGRRRAAPCRRHPARERLELVAPSRPRRRHDARAQVRECGDRSPSAANAITAQAPACAYWLPFSRAPGG
jgi:hypothetical protein